MKFDRDIYWLTLYLTDVRKIMIGGKLSHGILYNLDIFRNCRPGQMCNVSIKCNTQVVIIMIV